MREISNIELQCVVRELSARLAGGRIQKFYELGDGDFRLEVFARGERALDLAAVLKTRLGVTKFIRPAPKTPTQFAMQMRKHLEGAAILKVEQYGMDRVVYFDIEREGKKMRLLFEMFSDGNLVLAGDEGRIIAAYRREEWKDRTIKPRTAYIFPATGKVNPFDLSREKLRDIMDGKKLISCLAGRVNAGANYLEEVILRAGLPLDKQADKLTDAELWKLMDGFMDVFWGVSKPQPAIYYKDGKPFDYSPFHLSKYDGLERKAFTTMSEMLDEFYAGEAPKQSEEESKLEKERKKLEFALNGQREAVGGLRKKSDEAKLRGDKIYEKYGEVEALLERAKEKKERGRMEAEL